MSVDLPIKFNLVRGYNMDGTVAYINGDLFKVLDEYNIDYIIVNGIETAIINYDENHNDTIVFPFLDDKFSLLCADEESAIFMKLQI